MELTTKNIKIINDFTLHCRNKLGIKEPEIKIKLLTTSQKAPSAGGFNVQTKEVLCCIKNRAVADILRTIAHELTHMKQLLVDKIIFPGDDDGLQEFEDQANASSGKLVRFYGREHPEIYDDLN